MRFILWTFSAILWSSFGLTEPIAAPEAAPQQLTNNAPFSGAVYIVNPNGQVVAQGTNYCPASASVSCSSVNQPSWCCPSNYICATPANSNGLVGCCPSGSTCSGIVNVAQVTTVTVYPQQQTAVVYAQPPPATTVIYQATVAQAGYCATITMSGPGLPRAGQGQCGTIWIVSGTGRVVVGMGFGIAVLILQVCFGRMFWAS